MLSLQCHPFAAFAQKVVVALYETGTAFTPHLVDLGDPEARARHLALWPIGKLPVLRDHARDRTVAESTIIIEYLQLHYPGRLRLIPDDPDLALEVRALDRFFDLYVAQPMQKIVTDRLRPDGKADPFGVEAAREQLRTAYGMAAASLASRTWAAGEAFTLADCAAAPALFYADWVEPLEPGWPRVAAYLKRLCARPSFARVIEEARPYRENFPRAR